MQSSLLLFLLQLSGCFQLSRSQGGQNCSECLSVERCSNLPVIPHGFVSKETRKDEYREGDVIRFTCDLGYISFPTTRFKCAAEGWQVIHNGTCYLKPCQLPDNTPNGYYRLIHGSDFVFGATIKYFCNDGYQMVSRQDTRTCLLDNWTNHVPICEQLSCSPPPADGQVTITGLPENDNPVLPNRFITFSCDDPRKYLNGSSRLICRRDGQWDKPFPTCEDITCKVGEMHSQLYAAGLPTGITTVTLGLKLQFRCSNQYDLEGSVQIECLQTGEWTAQFPTCVGRCTVKDVPNSVSITTKLQYQEVRKGQKLKFACRWHNHFLQGKAEVQCLGDDQWSSPFPTCEVPLGCSNPPFLADGEVKETLKTFYSHNEWVEYNCQNLFTMSGQPFRTCINGEWIGDLRCLRPCTVDSDLMRQYNIDFMHRGDKKLYAPHLDMIEFKCVGQRRPVGNVGMRQQCNNGVMRFPTCI